jgi:NADH:ubiquinone oxidoreductase subunit F (NADH-binding)
MRYGKYQNKTWIWARIEKPTKLANDKYEITIAAESNYLHKNISGTSYTKAFQAKDGVKYYVCIAKINAATCTGKALSWVY